MRSAIVVALSALISSAASFSYECKNNYFPDKTQWMNEVAFIEQIKQDMRLIHNNEDEITNIMNYIDQQATNIGVDKRFIIAIMMRESSGDASRICGDDGASCGLFQVQDGNNPNIAVPSCHDTHPHPQSCPPDIVLKMIQCGTIGCNNGQHSNIQYCWQQFPNSYGQVARCYNSGEQSARDFPNNLSLGYHGVPSYVQDIANIVQGASTNGATATNWGAMSCH